jgi:tellurite resistance protein
MQLVRDVALADGELDAAEQQAIDLLSEVLEK